MCVKPGDRRRCARARPPRGRARPPARAGSRRAARSCSRSSSRIRYESDAGAPPSSERWCTNSTGIGRLAPRHRPMLASGLLRIGVGRPLDSAVRAGVGRASVPQASEARAAAALAVPPLAAPPGLEAERDAQPLAPAAARESRDRPRSPRAAPARQGRGRRSPALGPGDQPRLSRPTGSRSSRSTWPGSESRRSGSTRSRTSWAPSAARSPMQPVSSASPASAAAA